MIQIDMEMPKSCMNCPFAEADIVGTLYLSCTTPIGRKMVSMNLLDRKDRPEWCPLKEVKQDDC